VLFIVFDDFIADAGASYRQVLAFAGLPDDGRTHFPRVNENKALRPGLLPKFMFFAAQVKRRMGLRRSLGLWKKLQPALAEVKKRDQLNPLFRRELQDFFAADVSLLSQLVGRDLNYWCQSEIGAPTENVPDAGFQQESNRASKSNLS
jgi:hypothetical protein